MFSTWAVMYRQVDTVEPNLTQLSKTNYINCLEVRIELARTLHIDPTNKLVQNTCLFITVVNAIVVRPFSTVVYKLDKNQIQFVLGTRCHHFRWHLDTGVLSPFSCFNYFVMCVKFEFTFFLSLSSIETFSLELVRTAQISGRNSC